MGFHRGLANWACLPCTHCVRSTGIGILRVRVQGIDLASRFVHCRLANLRQKFRCLATFGISNIFTKNWGPPPFGDFWNLKHFHNKLGASPRALHNLLWGCHPVL